MTTKRFLSVMASILLMSAIVSAAPRRAQRPQAAPPAKHQSVGLTPGHDHGHTCMGHKSDISWRISAVVDYLRYHASIDVRQYARLTGIGIREAESELRRLARDCRVPISMICSRHGLYGLSYK